MLRHAESFGPEEFTVNGRFLTDIASWEIGTATVTFDPTISVKGKGGSGKVVANAQYQGMRQTVLLVPGTLYTLRAWVFGSDTDDLRIASADITLADNFFQDRTLVVGEWTILTVHFTPTIASQVIQIITLEASDWDPFWVGHMSLVEGTGDPPIFFPMEQFEYGPEQAYRLADANVIGDYPHDLIEGVADKDAGVEAVQFAVVGKDAEGIDTAIREMRSRLIRLGRNKLWVVLPDGTRQWSWCRATSMPSNAFGWASPRKVPASIQFRRYTDWFGEEVNGSFTIDTTVPTGEVWEIENIGDAVVDSAIITIASDDATDGLPPQFDVVNNSHVKTIGGTVYPQSFGGSITPTGANDLLRIKNRGMVAEFSTNNGTSYSPANGKIEGQAYFRGFMSFVPGVNSMEFEYDWVTYGAAKLTIGWSFRPQWH